MYALKRKAISLGVEYVDGEAVGFEFKKMPDMLMDGIEPGSYETVEKVLVCINYFFRLLVCCMDKLNTKLQPTFCIIIMLLEATKLVARGTQTFQKSRGHHKMLGVRY